MKIISNKSYKEYSELKFNAAHFYEPEIERLNKRIKEEMEARTKAEDLKRILDKLIEPGLVGGSGYVSISGGYTDRTISLSDDVLVYVEDILGGKVIKQEGNKCVVIDANGNVKTGITKQKPDKGYKYKLVRQ